MGPAWNADGVRATAIRCHPPLALAGERTRVAGIEDLVLEPLARPAKLLGRVEIIPVIARPATPVLALGDEHPAELVRVVGFRVGVG